MQKYNWGSYFEKFNLPCSLNICPSITIYPHNGVSMLMETNKGQDLPRFGQDLIRNLVRVFSKFV